jgi:hypothetical protein
VPNFKNILGRETVKKLETPSHYDHEKVSKAFDNLSSKPKSLVGFEKVQGRDDKLLYGIKHQIPDPEIVIYE